jgi:hypothetical protein
MEIEKRRAGKTLAKSHLPMTFSHAQRMINASIVVMRILGWAWRWAEWWVDYNSSWEPLLEPGQIESEMTNDELRKIDSTRESRCADARRCRLAAFGVSLQERLYDTEDSFDRESLDRALRAVLSISSLVGPLEKFEMKFLVEWLGRAYRSKSRLLGFGKDRIRPYAGSVCAHKEDQTPKFKLGNRPVPGKQQRPGGRIYETGVKEVDDFLKTTVLTDVPLSPSKPPRGGKSSKSHKKKPSTPKETRTSARSLSSTKKRKRVEPMKGPEGKMAAVGASTPSTVKKRRTSKIEESEPVARQAARLRTPKIAKGMAQPRRSSGGRFASTEASTAVTIRRSDRSAVSARKNLREDSDDSEDEAIEKRAPTRALLNDQTNEAEDTKGEPAAARFPPVENIDDAANLAPASTRAARKRDTGADGIASVKADPAGTVLGILMDSLGKSSAAYLAPDAPDQAATGSGRGAAVDTPAETAVTLPMSVAPAQAQAAVGSFLGTVADTPAETAVTLAVTNKRGRKKRRRRWVDRSWESPSAVTHMGTGADGPVETGQSTSRSAETKVEIETNAEVAPQATVMSEKPGKSDSLVLTIPGSAAQESDSIKKTETSAEKLPLMTTRRSSRRKTGESTTQLSTASIVVGASFAHLPSASDPSALQIAENQTPTGKRRGRPPRKSAASDIATLYDGEEGNAPGQTPTGKRRGRPPRKSPASDRAALDGDGGEGNAPSLTPNGKRRGRPPRKSPASVPASLDLGEGKAPSLTPNGKRRGRPPRKSPASDPAALDGDGGEGNAPGLTPNGKRRVRPPRARSASGPATLDEDGGEGNAPGEQASTKMSPSISTLETSMNEKVAKMPTYTTKRQRRPVSFFDPAVTTKQETEEVADEDEDDDDDIPLSQLVAQTGHDEGAANAPVNMLFRINTSEESDTIRRRARLRAKEKVTQAILEEGGSD